MISAERTRRVCCGMELDPLYVDTAVRRWEKYTGKQAVLEESGKTFVEVEAERGQLNTSMSDRPPVRTRIRRNAA